LEAEVHSLSEEKAISLKLWVILGEQLLNVVGQSSLISRITNIDKLFSFCSDACSIRCRRIGCGGRMEHWEWSQRAQGQQNRWVIFCSSKSNVLLIHRHPFIFSADGRWGSVRASKPFPIPAIRDRPAAERLLFYFEVRVEQMQRQVPFRSM
jgi:hypothetical protein